MRFHFTGPPRTTDGRACRWPRVAWLGLHRQERHHCNPNIPTEEVFTTPHALKVEATSPPPSRSPHQGTLIDNIQVPLRGGRIVEAKASKGEEVLNKVLDTDEGAPPPRRSGAGAAFLADLGLGRALLQHALRRKRLCHIALGQCYSQSSSMAPTSRRTRSPRRAAIPR